MNGSTQQDFSFHIVRILAIIGVTILCINCVFTSSDFDSRAASTNSVEWGVTLDFDEPGGSNDYVIFSEASDASDGIPVDSYDKPKAPTQPKPYIRARFNDGLPDPYSELLEDCRFYPDTYKVWNLSVQWVPSDYQTPTTITISWDTNDIESSEYDTVFLCDDSGSPLTGMIANNNYVFSCIAMIPQNFKIICEDTINQAPNTPNVPSGETNGYHGISYSYTTASTDPDQDNLYYKFDWGDGTTSEWLGPYLSEEQCDESHIFESPGTYNIKAKAKDVFDEESDWSSELSVYMANRAPNTPSSPFPENETQGIGVNTVLSWIGGDEDTIDIVTYDVYFGTENPPSLVVSKQSGTSFSPGAFNYDTTYYWKIVAWDNHDASTSGPIWSFTTESSGSSGNGGNGGGTDPPENLPPVANASAGEPYHSFVNTEILFNGTFSYDPNDNGYIKLWEWNFGDGTNGSGEIETHSYSDPGTYTVILSVTDDKDAQDTCETIVVIRKPSMPPTTPIVDGPLSGNKTIEYAYTAVSTDPDNDSIQYVFEWGDGEITTTEFLSNGTITTQFHSWNEAGIYTITVKVTDNETYSGDAKMTVLIDSCLVGELGYLLDTNSDGVYDLFRNDETGVETAVEQQGAGNYSIDTNGDGIWDYTYDPVTEILTAISEEDIPTAGKTQWFFIAILVIALTIIAIIVYLYKKNYF